MDAAACRIRRRSQYGGRGGDHAGALSGSLDHMAPHHYRSVHVPADPRFARLATASAVPFYSRGKSRTETGAVTVWACVKGSS